MKILAVLMSLGFLAGTFAVAISTPASAQMMKGKSKTKAMPKSKPCPPGSRRACY